MLPGPSHGLSLIVVSTLQPITPLSPRLSQALEQQLLLANLLTQSRRNGFAESIPDPGARRILSPLPCPFLLTSITWFSLLPFVSASKAETPAKTKLPGRAVIRAALVLGDR